MCLQDGSGQRPTLCDSGETGDLPPVHEAVVTNVRVLTRQKRTISLQSNSSIFVTCTQSTTQALNIRMGKKKKKAQPRTSTAGTEKDRHDDVLLRGAVLDELVVVVPNALSENECQLVEQCHVGYGSMGDEHDRQHTLSFAHEVWRIESQLQAQCPHLYDRLITKLMQHVDNYYWQMLQVAHNEYGDLRFINECKRGKDKVLIRPEVEYIVYDADEALRKGEKLPHIGPHTDNNSVVTLVCLLSDPAKFDGGINFFCPASTDGSPREWQLKQGECVLFRGERCQHWISDVTRGRRSILQIELALCAGTKDAPISSEQAKARRRQGKKGGSRKA